MVKFIFMDETLERANIPKSASLVFEGIRTRVYQWPQRLFDGTTATFEKTMRIPASTIIAVMDGHILIQEQEHPHLKESFLSLAGGHADSWEEPLLEVAKRELLEETGLISNNWQLLADLSRYRFDIFEHHLYIAKDCKKVSEPHLEGGEKITVKFVKPEEFKVVIEDPLWRHVDITNYLNKDGNFDKLVSLIKG